MYGSDLFDKCQWGLSGAVPRGRGDFRESGKEASGPHLTLRNLGRGAPALRPAALALTAPIILRLLELPGDIVFAGNTLSEKACSGSMFFVNHMLCSPFSFQI